MLDIPGLQSHIRTRFTRTLFRLETLDIYTVPTSGNDFARYLAGEAAPDMNRKQHWLDQLRSEADRGLQRRTVHMLRSPLGDYLRYECEWGYVYNTQAGDDVRILDLADKPRPATVIDHDFFVLDDREVLRMHYDAEGHFEGAEVLPDDVLPAYRAARDAAWEAAEPFELWWAAHPEEHRASRAS